MVTNSVVPIAKPPMASAMIAGQKCAACAAGAASPSRTGSVVWDIVTMVQDEAAPHLFLDGPRRDRSHGPHADAP